jgi:hypothetical protein
VTLLVSSPLDGRVPSDATQCAALVVRTTNRIMVPAGLLAAAGLLWIATRAIAHGGVAGFFVAYVTGFAALGAALRPLEIVGRSVVRTFGQRRA